MLAVGDAADVPEVRPGHLPQEDAPVPVHLVVDLDAPVPGAADDGLVPVAVLDGRDLSLMGGVLGLLVAELLHLCAVGVVVDRERPRVVPDDDLTQAEIKAQRRELRYGVEPAIDAQQGTRLRAPDLDVPRAARRNREADGVEARRERRLVVRDEGVLLLPVLEDVDVFRHAHDLAPLREVQDAELLHVVALVDGEGLHVPEVAHVPDLEHAGAVGRHELRRVRHDDDAADGGDVPVQPHDEVLDVRVPDANVVVEATAHQQPVVLGVGEAGHALLVPMQRLLVPPRVCIPQPDGLVHAPRGDHLQAVQLLEREHRVAVHIVDVRGGPVHDVVPLLHVLDIPERDLAVGAAETQQLL
mmetsp:Transcript_32203/g.102436  ORF Transcript_32203/g.102436 Transcript_32203/m.102436 type:complete len:357 (+) Transcript_32203:1770-2840(+)